MRYDKPPLERYTIEENGCWEWSGYKDSRGYGMAWHLGKNRMAHRIFFDKYIGNLDDSLTIDHLCKNRGCVNPDHMEQVTQSVNAKRGMKDNRSYLCPYGHIKDKKVIDHGYETMKCSTCARIRSKKWADANREKVREITRKSERKRRERNRRQKLSQKPRIYSRRQGAVFI